MESSEDFISYKKVLLFGDEGTGKTSFISKLETKLFNESIPHTSDNVKEYQIKTEIKGGKYLNINIYEIRTEDDIIYNYNLLDAFFFDCPCALFFMDITNPNSFDSIENVMTNINKEKYPYLKKIIVENKSDLEHKKSNEKMNKYINDNPDIDHITISLKNGNNLDELLLKIYNEINSPKKELIINQVKERECKLNEKVDYKGQISLILLGNSAVGKTNVFQRFRNKKFNPINTASSGIDCTCKLMKINDDKDIYKLSLYDTAGQERYKSLPQSYFRNVDGVLLLFDLIDKTSFDEVNKWMNQIKDFSKENDRNENDIIIYLIGNKIDLVEKGNEVIDDIAKKDLAEQLGIKYYEISCKWNLNIEEVIVRIVLDCIKKMNNQNENNGNPTITLNNISSNQNKRNECCINKKKEIKKDNKKGK